MSSAESLTHAELVTFYRTASERIISLENEKLFFSERAVELERQLEWFKRQVFGKRSEKLLAPSDKRQLSLGNEYEPEETPPPASTTVKSYERSHRKERVEFKDNESRLKFDDTVPVEVIHVPHPEMAELSQEQYEIIGEEVTHRLAQRPGAYVVLKYVRPKVKIKESGEITAAPIPPAARVIERSIAEVSFLVGLMLDKFLYYLPLYRQHQRLSACGVYLNRMTLTNLVHRSAELLEPVYRALQGSILESKVIAMDETPLKVERDPTKHQMKKGYLWAIYGECDEIAFLFSPSRSGEVVRTALETFTGTLLSDGYTVYERFAEARDDIVHAQCWVHSRRKFFEAKDDEPELCGQALSFIAELYRIEDELGCEKRETQARELVNQFFSWLREVFQKQALLPSNPFTKAATYTLKRERALRVFLDDPNVPLDTNHLERQIRPTVIGRKNWLFHWTEVGAEYAAILQSLIGSCRLQGVDPYTYLVDILQRIDSHPAIDVHLLTPRLWKERFALSPMISDLQALEKNALG